MNTTTTKKIQTISLSLLIFMAAMTINSSMQTSSIFADDDDELEGEVGEEGEVIAKLVANGDNDDNDKKNNVLLAPAPIVKKTPTQQTIVPVAEAQQQQPPVKQQPAPAAEEEEQDKGMKLVLGDIVLPINQKSDFSLELPFSKIVVEPITK